ncbi:MTH [Mytilus coruscus]|uniref:MTH n=1 Tax=Mytilus coruscus TaxID=42192 RepID=A0A6J8BBY9_MYTCO|nr:MTH [Mytilus coruscus]
MENYVKFCKKHDIALTGGYFFRPLASSQNDILDAPFSSSAANAKLKLYLKDLDMWEGETPHSTRSGCALTLAWLGIKSRSVVRDRNHEKNSLNVDVVSQALREVKEYAARSSEINVDSMHLKLMHLDEVARRVNDSKRELYSMPFKGMFWGVQYDDVYQPSRQFKNAANCQEHIDFINDEITSRLQSGAVILLRKVGEVQPPHIVSPITIEPTKPLSVIVGETKYSRNYTNQTFSTELQNHADNIEDDNTDSLHRNFKSMGNVRNSSITTETAGIIRPKRQKYQLHSTTPWKPVGTLLYKAILKTGGFSIKPEVDETSNLQKLDNLNRTTFSTTETIAEDFYNYNYENATNFLPEIYNDHYDDYESEMALCPRLNCSNWQCSCDEHCFIFDDCCYVMLERLFGTSEEAILADMMSNKTTAFQRLGYDKHQIKLAEMIAQYGECILVELSYHFFTVIGTCPDDNRNYFIENRCRNTPFGDIWDIPVYIKFFENYQITFRNIFCALCHGYNIKDVNFWNATLHCPDVHTPVLDGCFVIKNVSQHELLPNKCLSPYPKQLATCDHQKQNVESILCSSYVEPIIFGFYRFKNEHCIGCLSYNFPLDPNPKCELAKVGFVDHRPDYQGLDIFFAYDRYALVSDKNLIQITCPKGLYFDFITMSCTQISCPNGFIVYESQCIPNELHLSKDMHISIRYRLIMKINQTDTNVTDISIAKFENISNATVGVIKLFALNVDTFREENETQLTSIFIFNVTHPTVLYHLIQELNMLNVSYLTIASLDNFENKNTVSCPNYTFHVTLHSLEIDYINQTVVGLVPGKESIDIFYSRFSLTLLESSLSVITYCASRPCSRFFQYSAHFFNISNGTYSILGQHVDVTRHHFIQNGTLFVCEDAFSQSKKKCTFFTAYSSSQFEYVNGTLLISGAVTSAEHFVQDNTLYVCYNQSSMYSVINSISDVCMIVSLLSLLFMITCYIFLKGLRNLHGKNITMFSTSLFFAHAVFLVCRHVPLQKMILRVASICHHFLWLSVFAWTVVISTDIARRMVKMKRFTIHQKKTERRRFKIYALFAFIVPFIVVVTSTILDVQYSHLGYGKNGLCWISKQDGLLYFYIIPVGVALSYSLLCFFLILVKVQLSKQGSTLATSNQKNRVTFIIYFKLFFILGLSWIVGIISSKIDSIILSYINSVVNGLQGFFLTIVFMCNRHVKNVIQSHKKNSSKSEPQIKVTKDTSILS